MQEASVSCGQGRTETTIRPWRCDPERPQNASKITYAATQAILAAFWCIYRAPKGIFGRFGAFLRPQTALIVNGPPGICPVRQMASPPLGKLKHSVSVCFSFMNTRPAAAPTLNRKQSRKGTRGGDYENEEADPGGTRRTSCDVDPGKYVDPGQN